MEKMKKNSEKVKIVILSIAVVLLAIALIISLVYGIKSYNQVSNPYEITVKPDDNFVFLGDSITEAYPLDEFYDDLPVINSGVSGYTTLDLLEHLDEMVSVYNPTKVFILIGTNDIQRGYTTKQIIKNLKEVVRKILEKRPNVKIYIESVYPINNTDEEGTNFSVVGDRTNEPIQDLNKKIRKFCKESGYTYIDMYSELLDENGNLAIKYTKEGLHISNLGYLKITKVLYPYLQQ